MAKSALTFARYEQYCHVPVACGGTSLSFFWSWVQSECKSCGGRPNDIHFFRKAPISLLRDSFYWLREPCCGGRVPGVFLDRFRFGSFAREPVLLMAGTYGYSKVVRIASGKGKQLDGWRNSGRSARPREFVFFWVLLLIHKEE